MRFVKVKKANKNRDRGFIAVDAICSVFEDVEKHTTEIMTMDGMWYEVVDGVEHLFEDCEGISSNESKSDKMEFVKNRRMQSSALSEKSGQIQKEEEKIDDNSESKPFQRKRVYQHRKRFVKFVNKSASSEISKNFPSGDGEGLYRSNPKVEQPPESVGL